MDHLWSLSIIKIYFDWVFMLIWFHYNFELISLMFFIFYWKIPYLFHRILNHTVLLFILERKLNENICNIFIVVLRFITFLKIFFQILFSYFDHLNMLRKFMFVRLPFFFFILFFFFQEYFKLFPCFLLIYFYYFK